jgi:hypothetical protein
VRPARLALPLSDGPRSIAFASPPDAPDVPRGPPSSVSHAAPPGATILTGLTNSISSARWEPTACGNPPRVRGPAEKPASVPLHRLNEEVAGVDEPMDCLHRAAVQAPGHPGRVGSGRPRSPSPFPSLQKPPSAGGASPMNSVAPSRGARNGRPGAGASRSAKTSSRHARQPSSSPHRPKRASRSTRWVCRLPA